VERLGADPVRFLMTARGLGVTSAASDCSSSGVGARCVVDIASVAFGGVGLGLGDVGVAGTVARSDPASAALISRLGDAAYGTTSIGYGTFGGLAPDKWFE
jgi:hypothetical protein